MPKHLICLFFLLAPSLSFAQWIEKSTLLASWGSVHFTNKDTGFMAGLNGGLVKSMDGGNTWDTLSYPTSYGLGDLYFPSNDTGYLVGEEGIILKSVTKGDNWFISDTIDNTGGLLGVSFINNDTGFTVGFNGAIGRTLDGGATWTTSFQSVDFRSVFFVDEHTGYVAGDNGTIMKSVDLGVSWQTLTTGTNEMIRGLYFLNSELGYAVGENGTILRTQDGGDSWVAQQADTTGFHFNSVFFTSDDTGYIGGFRDVYPGKGIILKTVDGGNNWQTQLVKDSTVIYSIFFTNQDTGFASGYGIIFKTTNGGGPIINNLNKESSTTHPQVSVYPNPINIQERLSVKISDFTDELTMDIIDVYGRNLKKINLRNAVTFITLSDFSSGIYFFKVKSPTKGHIKTGKLIINPY